VATSAGRCLGVTIALLLALWLLVEGVCLVQCVVKATRLVQCVRWCQAPDLLVIMPLEGKLVLGS